MEELKGLVDGSEVDGFVDKIAFERLLRLSGTWIAEIAKHRLKAFVFFTYLREENREDVGKVKLNLF